MASDYLTAPFPGAVCLYALYDPRNGETRYIGKSVDPRRRYRRHQLSGQKPKPKSYCARWIAAVQRAGLEPQMRVLDWVEPAVWRAAERHYIALARAAGARLTNRTLGGDGSAGCRPTKLVRRRMSEAQKRVWAEDETRRERVFGKIRGRPRSPEFREKHRGQRRTPETCAKISAGRVRFWEGLSPEERAAYAAGSTANLAEYNRLRAQRAEEQPAAQAEQKARTADKRARVPAKRDEQSRHIASATMTRLWQDPVWRAQTVEASKRYHRDPLQRQRFGESVRSLHQDPVRHARWLHACWPHKYPDPDATP